MNSKTIHAISEVVLRLLGVVSYVGAIFLLFGGFFILGVDIIEGHVIYANSLGVVFTTSGTALFLMAAMVLKEEDEPDDGDYPPLSMLPVPKYFSSQSASDLSRSSEAHMCPSCGYENHHGVFFCEACNSPLWPLGTPNVKPLDRAVVEKRRMRIAARGKATRILLIGAILIIGTTPIWSFAVTGYEAVNGTQLTIQVVDNRSQVGTLGTVDVEAFLSTYAIPGKGELLAPAFTLTMARTVVSHLVCPDVLIYGGAPEFVCTVFSLSYSQFPPQTTMVLSMNAVMEFGLYQAPVTRTASSILS